MINYDFHYKIDTLYKRNGNFVFKITDQISKNQGLDFIYKFHQLSYYQNPIYKYYAFKFKINSVIVDSESYFPTISLGFKYNYHEYILNQNKELIYNNILPTDLIIEININNIYKETFKFPKISKYNEENEIILKPNINCYDQNLNINIKARSSYGYSFQRNFYLKSKIANNYEIDFQSNLFEEIDIPIYFENSEIIYQKFRFLKLFRNNFVYPKPIKLLFLFNYSGPLNYSLMLKNENLEGEINLKGIDLNSKDFKINYLEKNNYYIFYVNEYYYYDYKQKLSFSGISSEYQKINGLALPWDFSKNIGSINFNLFIEPAFNFDIIMPIFIENSIRGNQNSKYFLTEDLDYFDFDDPKIIWYRYNEK